MTEWTNIVEEMLKLDDLLVTRGDGKPLLWHCVQFCLLNERVASDRKLAEQYGLRWLGTLAIEEGKQAWVFGVALVANIPPGCGAVACRFV